VKSEVGLVVTKPDFAYHQSFLASVRGVVFRRIDGAPFFILGLRSEKKVEIDLLLKHLHFSRLLTIFNR
jgi:hypothetical protein